MYRVKLYFGKQVSWVSWVEFLMSVWLRIQLMRFLEADDIADVFSLYPIIELSLIHISEPTRPY